MAKILGFFTMGLEVKVMQNILLKIRILIINLRYRHRHLCLIYQKLGNNNRKLKNLSISKKNIVKIRNKLRKFD
jgi:hypothetical protein